jgi:hypothetical protein
VSIELTFLNLQCDSTIISDGSWVWIDISEFLSLLVNYSVTRQLSASDREFELTFLNFYPCWSTTVWLDNYQRRIVSLNWHFWISIIVGQLQCDSTISASDREFELTFLNFYHCWSTTVWLDNYQRRIVSLNWHFWISIIVGQLQFDSTIISDGSWVTVLTFLNFYPCWSAKVVNYSSDCYWRKTHFILYFFCENLGLLTYIFLLLFHKCISLSTHIFLLPFHECISLSIHKLIFFNYSHVELDIWLTSLELHIPLAKWKIPVKASKGKISGISLRNYQSQVKW